MAQRLGPARNAKLVEEISRITVPRDERWSTGKLPFAWPRSMDQIPINVGDKSYDPLFPFGFGLSYR